MVACATTLTEVLEAETLDADQAAAVASCRALCDAAAQALAAVVRRFERPIGEEDSSGLRPLIEAGVKATIECAAACVALTERVAACAECARACESCADALRRLLATDSDDDLLQRGLATN